MSVIKATEVLTSSGPDGLIGHVFHGEENEEVRVLQGTEDDVADMWADARAHRGLRGTRAGKEAKYACLHVAVSPGEAMTREQAGDAIRRWCGEFGVPFDVAVIVEHKKPRQDDGGHERHWHALVPGIVVGRVVDRENQYARQEKVARLTEIACGHALTKGAHNERVRNALIAEGKLAEAELVAPLAEGARPHGGYSTRQHQAAKRVGIHLPAVKAEAARIAAEAWRHADGGAAFVGAMADRGLRLSRGEKRNTILVHGRGADGDWVFLTSLDRLLNEKKAAVAARFVGVDLDAGAAGRAPEAAAAFPVPSRPPPKTVADMAFEDLLEMRLDDPALDEDPPPFVWSAAPIRPDGATDGDVAPLDPFAPSDRRRFLREWTAAEVRRPSGAPDPIHGMPGGSAADAAPNEETSVDEAAQAAQPDRAHDGRDRGPRRRVDGRPGSRPAGEHAGQQGPATAGGRGPARRGDRRAMPVGHPGTEQAASRGGEDRTRRTHRPDQDADRDGACGRLGPGGADPHAAGRARLASRRAVGALAGTGGILADLLGQARGSLDRLLAPEPFAVEPFPEPVRTVLSPGRSDAFAPQVALALERIRFARRQVPSAARGHAEAIPTSAVGTPQRTVSSPGHAEPPIPSAANPPLPTDRMPVPVRAATEPSAESAVSKSPTFRAPDGGGSAPVGPDTGSPTGRGEAADAPERVPDGHAARVG